jgi:hypothetical protein
MDYATVSVVGNEGSKRKNPRFRKLFYSRQVAMHMFAIKFSGLGYTFKNVRVEHGLKKMACHP